MLLPRFIDGFGIIIVCKLFLPYINWVSQFKQMIFDDNYKINIMQINATSYDLGKTISLRININCN